MSNLMLDVGDGLCVRLQGPGDGGSILDCGSQSGGGSAAKQLIVAVGSRTLARNCAVWVSHFHADHYNGFVWAAHNRGHFPRMRSLRLLLTPALPDVPRTKGLVCALFALAAYSLGSRSGVAEVDLRRVISLLSGGAPFTHRRLLQGDTIDEGANHRFLVVWPPRELPPYARTAVAESLAAFHGLIQKPGRDKLRHLYDDTESLGLGSWGEDSSDLVEPELDARRVELDAEQATQRDEELYDVERRLRRAANYLSLALVQDGEILLLGDLDELALRDAVAFLTAQGLLDFYAIVAPHHGTTWNNDLLRLRSKKVFVSVGDRLWQRVVPGLGRLSRHVQYTRTHGDLRF